MGLAGDALFRLPWLHRTLLENLVRRGPEALDVVPGWLRHAGSDVEILFCRTACRHRCFGAKKIRRDPDRDGLDFRLADRAFTSLRQHLPRQMTIKKLNLQGALE